LRLFGWAPFGQELYLSWCQELAGELGLGDAVTFEGRVQDSRMAFAAGQVAVLSSISEGFPYTVIEAMACGRPCVATDVGGVTEALGTTGLVVPPRRPDELARACLVLLRDVDLRRRLGSAARARVLELFTLDRALGEYREIYGALTSGGRLPIEESGREPDALLALGTPG
jgi:glycosyltransferase involved in cell wall biosynthesis